MNTNNNITVKRKTDALLLACESIIDIKKILRKVPYTLRAELNLTGALMHAKKVFRDKTGLKPNLPNVFAIKDAITGVITPIEDMQEPVGLMLQFNTGKLQKQTATYTL